MTPKHVSYAVAALSSIVLVLLSGGVASAAAIEVVGSGLTRTIACGDQNIVLGGAVNIITLTGSCPKIEITGTGNVVTVEAVGTIEINGTSNSVGWSRSLVGTAPRVATTLPGNRVFQADAIPVPEPAPAEPAPAPPAEPAPAPDVVALNLLDNGLEQTIDCQERRIDLLGNDNLLTLTGTCVGVRVIGNSNRLAVERVSTIEVLGISNTVTWQIGPDDDGTAPTITVLGADSSVAQEALP